jgi:drug/metabolite transporter (DMT)-like permease
MYLEILSKIISESLLSLYPIFVKYINLNFWLQIYSRFFIYVFISGFFINWKFILQNILSKYGIILSLITILHVYLSYRGFLILESGIAYIIFYLYPIMILLISGEKIGPIIIFAVIGVIILSSEKIENFSNIFEKNKKLENFRYEGIIMMILAALTEALIYFIVRQIKTNNSWNHVFISYAFGAFILSFYYWKDIKNIEFKPLKN